MMYREEEIREQLTWLYAHPNEPLAVDTETTGLNTADTGPEGDIVIGISCTFIRDDKPEHFYVGINHTVGDNCDDVTLDSLLWVLEQPRPIILANAVFDITGISQTFGTYLDRDARTIWEVIVMAHLINENGPGRAGSQPNGVQTDYSLDSLAKFYLGKEKVSDPFLEEEKKTGWKNTTPERIWEYAVTDTDLTYELWITFLNHKEWSRIPESYWGWKSRFIKVLCEMYRRGARVDVDLCQEMIDLGNKEMAARLEECGEIIGMKIKNFGPIAATAIFIDYLELPALSPSVKTGKPSFKKEVLEEYEIMMQNMLDTGAVDADSKSLIEKVLNFRGWQKAVSAAYKSYVDMVDSDGRIRCNYKMHGTKTGRLSCEKPNLQQVPKSSDKEWNGRVKECFIPKDGYVLVNADFSQLELRVGTCYARESRLKEIFDDPNRDVFDEMSAQLGMKRFAAKTLTYTIQYGGGVKRVSTVFGIQANRAREIIDNYRQTYPAFRRLNDWCMTKTKQDGELKLWTGRHRHFFFKSDDYKSMNSLIQGGAADVMERIMVRCFEELDCEDAQMLLQVHDSLTWEVKAEKVEEYMPLIEKYMSEVVEATGEEDFGYVPFAVEVEFWTKREEERYGSYRLHGVSA